MRRPLLALLLLTLCASWSLGPLDCLQAFAWAKMIGERSASGSLSEAIESTFDPAKPCALCREIKEVRSQQNSDEAPTAPAPETESRWQLSAWTGTHAALQVPLEAEAGARLRPTDSPAWSSVRQGPEPPPPRRV